MARHLGGVVVAGQVHVCADRVPVVHPLQQDPQWLPSRAKKSLELAAVARLTLPTGEHGPELDLAAEAVRREVEADLVDQLFNSSENRLARALLLLANFGKDDAPQPLSKNISQATLAGIVGTTRSRVSSFMNKFRKLGFIDYNGDLKVNSSLLNVVLRD